MYNQDIRQAAKEARIQLWRIAERYNGGMTDGNFSRKLRRELPKEEKRKILQIIDALGSEVQR